MFRYLGTELEKRIRAIAEESCDYPKSIVGSALLRILFCLFNYIRCHLDRTVREIIIVVVVPHMLC